MSIDQLNNLQRYTQVLANMKKDLETKDVQSLRDLCDQKGLKKGGGKADLLERLVTQVAESGEVDAILARAARAERKEELMKMTKEDLQKVCHKKKIDPIIKEVMVERILAHEAGLIF